MPLWQSMQVFSCLARKVECLDRAEDFARESSNRSRDSSALSDPLRRRPSC